MIRWSIAIGLGLFVAWLAYARSLTAGQRARVLVLAAVRFAAVLLVAALFLGAPAAPPSPAGRGKFLHNVTKAKAGHTTPHELRTTKTTPILDAKEE